MTFIMASMSIVVIVTKWHKQQVSINYVTMQSLKTYIIKACIIVGIISANFGRNVINSFKTLNAFI
jgi:hypothetical protein